MQHAFILQPYKGMNTRFNCPECQKQHRTFSRYINTETGAEVADNVGRCNRESNCGYHYTPKQYFQDHNIELPKPLFAFQKVIKPVPLLPTSFINPQSFRQSLTNYNSNNFILYLNNLLGEATTLKLIETYHIGTSRHWQGASIFWQIDNLSKIRTGKIMLYNQITGRRVKEPYQHITWVHKQIKEPNYNLVQSIFGLHLLKGNTKPVAIVESEKTAIIASAYLPKFIWLAAGSLCNLNKEKCQPLKGRNVTLFPDLNGYTKWLQKSTQLTHITKFRVSNLLEKFATKIEKGEGLDLADYLIRFPILEFKIPNDEEAFI